MGYVQAQESHVESLSGMSYAWRWARVHAKLMLSVTAASVAALLLFASLLYGTALKRITVEADGQTYEFVTSQSHVQDLLTEKGISVGEFDRISKPLSAVLADGDRLIVERAFPVSVTADGKTTKVFAVEGTVSDMLADAGIELGPLDRVEPSVNATVTQGSEIKIVRVSKVIEETEHTLPYKTIKQKDGSLLKGKQKVVQAGREGVLVKQIEKVYEDGVLVAEQVVSKDVEQSTLDHIVAVGTKAAPAPAKSKDPVVVLTSSSANVEQVSFDGKSFGVKNILKGVKLTAYSAGFASTGKRKGDKGYGITASGTTVSEGRTIAVDPGVIPMGWWVYIEGIGFRRAEDKGSAIKGKKIDIYFDSEAYAKKFGTKYGYTVYVIGPKKPVAN
ncbi:3D domain-containing protein [Paenibacillus alkalitolerans]|uniref:3D domain-containing protein n=1 Tax=Paenibacillus alkalitolerans TaxID=2799335 RepID=UPI0018F440A4|nr:3D domain-containing protein [Paenibacillus alkalitolerans]